MDIEERILQEIDDNITGEIVDQGIGSYECHGYRGTDIRLTVEAECPDIIIKVTPEDFDDEGFFPAFPRTVAHVVHPIKCSGDCDRCRENKCWSDEAVRCRAVLSDVAYDKQNITLTYEVKVNE